MRAFIFGAGAHGRVILDVLRAQNQYQSIEFIDDNQTLWGEKINGAMVAGNFNYLLELERNSFRVIVAIGNPLLRLSVAKKMKENSMVQLNAIHPSAVVASTVTMGVGNMICATAVINSNTQIGNNVIINTAAVVEHDCVVADGVNVSPQACVGGRVTLKRIAFVGSGAVILGELSIGATAIIGAGSVVTKDVPDKVLVVGTPAKIVETIDETFNWQRLL